MRYVKGKKRAKRKVSDVAELVHMKDSFDFFKYGTLLDDLLDEEEIEDMEEDMRDDGKAKKSGKGDKEAGPADEMETHHKYNILSYEKRDLYKEDLGQYDLAAMDIMMDTTHFTSQDWRLKVDVHTQDPHLRRLVLKEKML